MSTPEESDHGGASNRVQLDEPEVRDEFCCPACGFTDPPNIKTGVSAPGCLVMLALNVLCLPLIILAPIFLETAASASFFTDFLREEYHECRRCRKQFHIQK